MRNSLSCLFAALLLPACASGIGDSAPDDGESVGSELETIGTANIARAGVKINRVTNQAELAKFAGVQTGAYQIHNIDVGTGLAVLVRGSSFTLLFDGGSNDDSSGISSSGNSNRLLAYLAGALGPSGPPECTPGGEHDFFPAIDRSGPDQIVHIDHLVLSHSHSDHVALLADVLKCYAVDNVWEPGSIDDTVVYWNYLTRLSKQPSVILHTAAAPTADKTVQAVDKTGKIVKGPLTFGDNVKWEKFVEFKDDKQTYPLNLAGTASFKILHADGTHHDDANQNSLVMRLDLSDVSMLLVGDSESGSRLPPLKPVGDVEQMLIGTYSELIDVDIHQAGHHGSLSSNRDGFVKAVSPQLVLIGAGPQVYGKGVVLPDPEIITEYESVLDPQAKSAPASAWPTVVGTPLSHCKHNANILRTDEHDRYVVGTNLAPKYVSSGCLDDDGGFRDRIGQDNERPGGCDNYVVQLSRSASFTRSGAQSN